MSQPHAHHRGHKPQFENHQFKKSLNCSVVTKYRISHHMTLKTLRGSNSDYRVVVLTVRAGSSDPELHVAGRQVLQAAELVRIFQASAFHSGSPPGAAETQTCCRSENEMCTKKPAEVSCHLLIMKVHVEVVSKGQGVSPADSPQRQGDRFIIQQEVKHILLSMKGAHHPI